MVPEETPIITVVAKKIRFTPLPNAAMSATPRRPTMTRSIVPARTSRKFAMITGHARLRIDRRRRPAGAVESATGAAEPRDRHEPLYLKGQVWGALLAAPGGGLQRSSPAGQKGGEM